MHFRSADSKMYEINKLAHLQYEAQCGPKSLNTKRELIKVIGSRIICY